MYFVMISTLLVILHTDLEQSSFEVDYDYAMCNLSVPLTVGLRGCTYYILPATISFCTVVPDPTVLYVCVAWQAY